MHPSRSTIVGAAALSLLFAPAAHGQISRRVERTANEAGINQEIRARVAAWQAAIDQKRADRVAAMYLPHATFMAPNSPSATGRQIRNAWADIFRLPGVSLKMRPATITPSDDGSMAYEVGSYDLRFRSQTGPVNDRGKYVVVWTRPNGEWKVAADIFNSDLPAGK